MLNQARSALCLAAMLLGGCSSVSLSELQAHRPTAEPPSAGEKAYTTWHSREHREVVMQIEWSGRKYDALVAAYGPPRMLMYIPGDRPNESVAVYGVRDPASGCIDAFTVFHGRGGTAFSDESTVTNYFCR